MQRHETDKSSKWLIQHQGGSILRLAGAKGIKRWKALQAEIVQPRKLPDGLLEVYFEGESKPDYVLLEIATYPEKRIAKQVTDDLTLAQQQLGVLPEALTVVLAEKGQLQISGQHEIQSRLRWSRLITEWKVIELWKLSAEELLAMNDVGVVPWVPLTHFDGPPEELLSRCRQRIEQQASYREQPNLLVVSQVLAALRYNDPQLLALFGGRKGMTEFPLIQQFITETRQQDIFRILQTRFKDVPEGINDRLKKVQSEKQLEELLTFAVNCSSPEAFQRRLKK